MSIIGIIIGFIAFVIGCIYAVGEFGFFLGLGLGWIPAFFIGFFVGIVVDLIITAIFIAFALAPLRKVYLEDLKRRREEVKPATPRHEIDPLSERVEKRVQREGLDIRAAYLRWVLLGSIGAHRAYLGSAGTATVQFVLNFFIAVPGVLMIMAARHNGQTIPGIFIIGLLVAIGWYLLDAFLIPVLFRKKQSELRKRIRAEMASTKPE